MRVLVAGREVWCYGLGVVFDDVGVDLVLLVLLLLLRFDVVKFDWGVVEGMDWI